MTKKTMMVTLPLIAHFVPIIFNVVPVFVPYTVGLIIKIIFNFIAY